MTQPFQRKIIELDRLPLLLQELRTARRTIVQCHGCFDIVHPGHLRYLEAARRLGDVLLVSLTGDGGISKGPGRPYIPQELRAESLAALEFVNYVVVDPHPTACEILETIRPDVYVKGREYADASDPRFAREKAIVEQHGGRVVFHSGDVVFSSTRLLHGLPSAPELDWARLRALCSRNRISRTSLGEAIERMHAQRVVVVGDAYAERYEVCDAGAIAEDAPTASLRWLESLWHWGGSVAIARQARALGARVALLAGIGSDAASGELCRAADHDEIDAEWLLSRTHLPQRRTFMADDAKLLRVSQGDCQPLDSALERRAIERISTQMDGAALLIWHDAGFGTLTPGLVRAVSDAARSANVPTCVCLTGAGSAGFLPAQLLCGAERNLREAARDMSSGLPAVTWTQLQRCGGAAALISLHKRGVMAFDGRPAPDALSSTTVPLPERLRSEFFPAASQPVDLLGGVTAMCAAGALMFTAGGSAAAAAYIANAVHSLAVSRVGLNPVDADELFDWIAQRPELNPDSRFIAGASPRHAGPAADEAACADSSAQLQESACLDPR